MRILIADDHELHRKVLGARLRRHGHTLLEASDGAEAMEILKKQKIDAVIADILMPKVDGYELCAKIRKSPRLSRLPVIVYSAIYTSPDDEKAALASGANFFFRKPISEEVILSSLEQVINQKSRRATTKVKSKKKPELKEYSARLVDRLEHTVEGLEAKSEQLEKSEERFRSLLNTISAAVFIYQREKILYVNRAAQELTGFTLDDLVQKRPAELIHPKDRELGERRLFMGAGIVDVSSRIAIRMIARDGKTHWLDFSASSIDYKGKEAVIGTAFDITERKEAEAHLRESEERYRGLVENSLGLICIHDMNGMLLMVNPAAAKQLGYHVDEMVGRNMKEFLAPAVRDRFDEYLQRISKTRMDNGYMRALTRKGNERTWFYHNVLIQNQEQGQYVLGHALDVTDQMETDERLRKSEEQLRMIINTEPECVKITSKDGIVLQMNPAGLTMLEAADESMVVGKSAYDVIAPEYHEKYRELTADVFKGKPGLLEFEIVGMKGRRRWLETHAVPLHDERGKITTMLSVTRDITERRRTESKIREQAALLDIDPAAISVQDTEGRILFWNRTGETIYGWHKDEVVGTSYTDHFPKEVFPKLEEARRITLEKGRWRGEWSVPRKDGKELAIESEWTLVLTEDGKPKSIYVVDSDVTDKKKLETQFLRAQRMESLGLVAGGIAHDLNNVLGPILLSVQALQRHSSDKNPKKFLSMIETSAKRGAEIVKLILGFARGTEGGRIVLQPGHLAKEVAQLVHRTFPKSIRFEMYIPKNLWSIQGNATNLHQVLINLAVNARDAMPGGGVLTLTGENVILDEQYTKAKTNVEPGPYVMLGINDTGTGIPQGIRDRIFEPFFTTKESEKGTGLGLSVVAGIIQNHGGFTHVYSELGRGTEFKVYLPAIQSPETEEAQRQSEDLPRGNGETVLVVEDELTVQEITKETLETFGYRTLTANDGTEAVALYVQEARKIEIVLCDMAMPLMDGQMTIRALGKINPDVKIIVASGFSDAAKALEQFGKTVRAFLPKPFSTEKLLRAIHTAIQEPEQR